MFGEKLFTRRLQMRKIRAADLPLLLVWSNCEEAYGPYLTPERLTARELNDKYKANGFWNLHDKTFLIEKRESGLPIGTIHYWLRQDQEQTAVVSLKIANVSERGQGYGTEAQKFLIIHLFEQANIKIVEMYTDIDNLSQQRCLQKLGFSINRSLTYVDHLVVRIGHLFRLTIKDFQTTAIYRFHYE